jgi:hypothetical protein
MLTDEARTTLTHALNALRDGDGGHWQALAPLTQLSA